MGPLKVIRYLQLQDYYCEFIAGESSSRRKKKRERKVQVSNWLTMSLQALCPTGIDTSGHRFARKGVALTAVHCYMA